MRIPFAFALLINPFKLKFDFLVVAFALMFNVKGDLSRDIHSLTSNLNAESFAFFKAVGQPTQFLNALLNSVGFFNIAMFFLLGYWMFL